MNHTHVIQAKAHLAAVSETREHLQALYSQQRRDSRDSSIGVRIAEAHQAIGFGLKMAHIHATLAVAEAMAPRETAVTL